MHLHFLRSKWLKAIFLIKKRVLPCASLLNGAYDVEGLFVGVPVVIGKEGVEHVIELELLPEEKNAFNRSKNSVAKVVEELKGLLG